jgi:hypothetical protein
MTAQETNVANSAETTLSAGLAVGATTINVTDGAAFPAVPFYAVIEPGSDANREIVLVDSAKTGTSFTLSAASKRGQDGTTDVAHDSGVTIAMVPVAALWTDVNDRIDALPTNAYVPGGTDVAVADGGTGASTAAGARTNLGAQAQSAVLDATTASFTTAKDTKLTGIEALADVTDAANVAAAGAVMESDTTTAAMGFVLDEDNMASDSATKLATQQSIKAYVDSVVAGSSGPKIVVKAADESVASSVTLQNDDELLAPLLANTDYAFEAFLHVVGNSANDITIAFTVPTGATLAWSFAPEISFSTNAPVTSTLVTASGTGQSHEVSAGMPIHIRGTVRVGGTAGNLQMQFAQRVSNATASTVKAGSHLIVSKEN